MNLTTNQHEPSRTLIRYQTAHSWHSLYSYNSWLIILFFFIVIPSFLHAQTETLNNSAPRTVRIVWSGGEHALRYGVEIERLEDGVYKSYLHEYSETLFYNVSLLPGEYRYRIIPHDVLDRPGEGTLWVNFEIRQPQIINNTLAAEPNEQIQIIGNEQLVINNEQGTINNEQLAMINKKEKIAAGFNALGVSLGTAFVDPVVILSLFGTYAPFKNEMLQNIFFELGCDFGFVSTSDLVESYYSFYPFANVGYSLPFSENIVFFAGIGFGYMFGKYSFAHGDSDINVFAFNLTTGVYLFDMLNICYTLRTNFSSASNKVAVGYVFKF